MAQRVRIWDLPTRIFHWWLAALLVAQVVTANVGGNAMVWHLPCGYAVIALLLFRLVWGLVGGHWSRFRAFRYGPSSAWHYLRGRLAEPAGHSPLGALSVYALLAALAVQAASGLFSDDEIAFSGPLTALVPSEWVGQATWLHTEVGKLVVLGLVLLHLLAIAYYALVRRRTLVAPMVHGDKLLDASTPASRDDAASRLLALGIFAACAGAVASLVQFAG